MENAYIVLCVFKLSGAMVLCTLTLPMWFMRPNKIADVKDIFYRISQDMKNIFCLQITWNFFSHGQDFVRTLNQTVGGSKIQIYCENIKLLWCSYYFGWLIFEKGLNPWGGSTVQDKIPKKDYIRSEIVSKANVKLMENPRMYVAKKGIVW